MGNREKETPKQFRFEKTEKDGITETMRVFTGDEQPPITEKQPMLTDDDLGDIDFGLPKKTKTIPQTDTPDYPFDMRISVPPEKPVIKNDEITQKDVAEIEFGEPEGTETIGSVVKKAAERRTVLYKENLMKALARIKQEEGKKKK